MSQEGLAAVAGLHRVYMGRVERGSVSLTICALDRVARALGLKLSDITDGIDVESEDNPRSEIAQVLRERVTDPRVGMLTITHVDVAPDMRSALVLWSALDPRGPDDVETASRGLESAAPFVRRELAQRLPLKRMPELRFRHDPSLEKGSEMLSLLREIADGDAREIADGDARGIADGDSGEIADGETE